MGDITIPRERLPRVTVGEQGWMSCDGASFSPATSLKLARIWAARYIAIAEFLEAQDEQQQAVSETDRALAVCAEELYAKALSKLTDREREGATKLLEAREAAGMLAEPAKEESPDNANANAMVIP